jgi:Protein of unknown function (DUF3800)
VYVHIDETGDAGLQFDRGSSAFFVVGLIFSDDVSSLRLATATVRHTLRWPLEREFKFSGTHDAAKELYLQAIRREPFHVHIMAFDKRRLDPNALRQDFYGHLVGLALEDVVENIRGAHLILDESFKGKGKQRTFRTQLRSRISQPGRKSVLRNLSYRSSRTDEMLQVADMVVGAVGRAYKREDHHYRSIINAKIVSEYCYP